MKRRQEEAERALDFFFPKFTRRHPKNECPLNVIEVCLVCEENHATNKCPFPGLKVVYQGEEGGGEQLYLINERRPQGPRPYQQGMQGASYSYYHPNQNETLPPWCSSTHPSWSTPSPWPYAP